MRIEASVTSVSWIPSTSVTGVTRAAFEAGLTHYDEPPPDHVGDAAALRELAAADRFRFANRLAVQVQSSQGRIESAAYQPQSSGIVGGSTVRVGRWQTRVAAVALPELRSEPTVGGASVILRQTAGGRAGLPAPRTGSHAPFVALAPPLVWTTLEVTVHADGRIEHALVGGSPFPRHWVYGPDGELTHKSSTIDFAGWYATAGPEPTPWGRSDSEVVVSQVETSLERALSARLMRTARRARVETIAQGSLPTEQGDPAGPIFLLLDGVATVEVDGHRLGEIGPGAVIGERAFVDATTRTATVRAQSPVRVAVFAPEQVDRSALVELMELHRREEPSPP